MADEEDAGAAYLAALRQSRGPQGAGAAAARAPEVPGAAGSAARAGDRPRVNVAGSEKRKSPRYICDGSVRLQESGSQASTWARFTDISVHGCYIESAVPYPQRALLELKLEANGFHVEAVGDVRVTYPGLGMGISFVKMSEVDRGKLRALIASISPSSVILGPRFSTQDSAGQPSESAPPVTNPNAALQAMLKFFENRHVMGRDEFLRILRTNQ
jgi:hypothetical protein